jgi:CBS domain-containing protein
MTRTDTPVEELMNAPVVTVAPDATVVEAAATLDERGIGSLVVGEDPIQGILTEGDIVASVAAERDLASTTVAEVMSDPVVTVRPGESVAVAGERMGHNGVKKLPVTEDGRVVGIVTTTDLAHHLPRQRVTMTAQREPDVTKGEFE